MMITEALHGWGASVRERTCAAMKRAGDTLTPLSVWFADHRDLSGPHDDHERDKILNDLVRFDQFAVNGELVILRTAKGRAMIRPNDVYPDAAITIVYALHGSASLVAFWMNRSSLAGLFDRITEQGDPVDFDSLLAQEVVL